jgi:hypothetical protein
LSFWPFRSEEAQRQSREAFPEGDAERRRIRLPRHNRQTFPGCSSQSVYPTGFHPYGWGLADSEGLFALLDLEARDETALKTAYSVGNLLINEHA